MPPAPLSAAPKRRWFQWSLRTLFVVVTVLSVALGIVLHRARTRREALRAIDELGGGYSITIGGTAWLRSIVNDDKYFYDISRISFRNTPERPFTDENLASVIDSINTFKRPKLLDLTDTDVTDNGLPHLYRVRNLEGLRLGSTTVADAGLTDAGLVKLEPLSSLKTLDISNTKATDEGIARFKRSVPGCRVQHFQYGRAN